MTQADHDQAESEEVVNWWDKDEIYDADLEAALSLNDFTQEFVLLLKKSIDENPELRKRIDKLCDYKLYEDLVTLLHYQHPLNAIDFTIPDSLKVDFIRLRRKVMRSRLDMDEFGYFQGGEIARALREALGYDIDLEMGDEFTREQCLKSLEREIGTIERGGTRY